MTSLCAVLVKPWPIFEKVAAFFVFVVFIFFEDQPTNIKSFKNCQLEKNSRASFLMITYALVSDQLKSLIRSNR